MATQTSNIVTNGLKICIDPANDKSYPGTGVDVYDLSPALGIKYSIVDQASWNTSNNGSFTFPTPIGTATASRISSNTLQNLNTAEMTIDVWFKRTVSNNSYNIIWSSFLPYFSFTSANNFLFSWTATIQRTLYSTKTYLDNVWYNVCCTLTQDVTSGTSIGKIYVNGVLETTSPTYTGVTQVAIYNVYFNLGNFPGIRYPFVGNISCFKLYDRILTDSEILQNFNALKSRFEL
jgi:hypothetical protein